MHHAQQGSVGSAGSVAVWVDWYLDQIDVVLVLKRAEQADDALVIQVDLDADLPLHLPPDSAGQQQEVQE